MLIHKQFQQWVKEQLTFFRDAPFGLAFGDITAGQRLIQRVADPTFIQTGKVGVFMTWRRLQQPEPVHEKLEREIRRLDPVAFIQVFSLHITAWVAYLDGAQYPAVGLGQFAVRAAADTEIVTETSIIEIVLALKTRLGIGRGFILPITGGGEQRITLLVDLPKRIIVGQYRWPGAKQRIGFNG